MFSSTNFSIPYFTNICKAPSAKLDVNLYLGENVFTSSFSDGTLKIFVKYGMEKFVDEKTKIYAYYPIGFEKNITANETVAEKTDEYIITEYKL